jgi:transposase
VLTVDEWITIRELGKQGMSVSEIGRRTSRDRKTIRKVLSEPTPTVRRKLERPRASKLAPYRDYLVHRVGQGCLNGAVLLEEITQRGYTGKRSILRDFLAPMRRDLVRKREATERFETGPGQQAQVDWGEFGQIWDSRERRWRKLYAFVCTLGYSRASYLEFTTGCDMEHFLGCHLGAFGALGIAETVLYDNLKTGILGRGADGTPILPGRFLDFALYYDFRPRYCQPYRARTKGKVERGIGYVRQNFWVRVAEEVRAGQLELAGLNARAREWAATVANRRVHGTHGEVVAVRYAVEEPRLAKLTGRPLYDTAYHSVRRVGRDGRFAYRGHLYQLPLRHALSAVDVAEALDGQVSVRVPDGEPLRPRLVETAALVEAGRARTEPPAQRAAARGLRVLPAPVVVETRDLAVYEEVAHAGVSS